MLMLWLLLLVILAASKEAQAAASDGSELRLWIPRMHAKRAIPNAVEELARDYRVVVVMTTIPKRIERIEPVIDAMLAQTWPVAAVYMSVPYRYNRTGEEYKIPAWLQKKPGLTLVRCEDLGPGTHILNGLRLERDPSTFLAVVDDDHIYSPDLVENLMRAALAQPGVAVAAQGFLSIPGLAPELEKMGKSRPRYLHDQGFGAGPVLVSYLGAVYQRGFFDDAIFDYSKASLQCKYQDDMWFSAHLAQKGIKRMVLGAAMGVHELRDMHLGPESLTFWKENKPREVSADCNSEMLAYRPDLWVCRRRVVLVLGGLPPAAELLGGPAADSGAQDWHQALSALAALKRPPDLTYLCTEGWPDASIPGWDSPPAKLGASFRLAGLLVSSSEGCKAFAPEPRVTLMLGGPLSWEGDFNTVVVLATVPDILSQAKDLWAVARCAAELCSSDDRSDDKEPGPDACGLDLAAGEEPSQALEPAWPWCRLGKLAAISTGALVPGSNSTEKRTEL